MRAVLATEDSSVGKWHSWGAHRAFPEIFKVCIQAYVSLLRRVQGFLALLQLRCQAGHLRFQRDTCLFSLSFIL